MLRSAIQIYALAVCFSTLMCLAVALGIGLYDVVQIAAPQFTLAWIDPYSSNERFLANHPEKKDLPANEVERFRAEGLRQALVAERRAAQQSAVFVLIVLAIDALMFAVHWRLARRSEHAAFTSSPRPVGATTSSPLVS